MTQSNNFFLKNQLHGNISLRFGREIMEGFSEILRHATGYCSNYYENQSNKLIIILNQSNNCYPFSSISNKTVKIKRTVINQNVSEIFDMLLSI